MAHFILWKRQAATATATITTQIHLRFVNAKGEMFLANDYLKWLECFYWHFIGKFRQSFVHCFGFLRNWFGASQTVYVFDVHNLRTSHQTYQSWNTFIFASNLIIDKHFLCIECMDVVQIECEYAHWRIDVANHLLCPSNIQTWRFSCGDTVCERLVSEWVGMCLCVC